MVTILTGTIITVDLEILLSPFVGLMQKPYRQSPLLKSVDSLPNSKAYEMYIPEAQENQAAVLDILECQMPLDVACNASTAYACEVHDQEDSKATCSCFCRKQIDANDLEAHLTNRGTRTLDKALGVQEAT